MTKDLGKTIMMKLKTKSQHVKWPSRGNYLPFKKAKSKYNSAHKKAKKDYFEEATKYGVTTNNFFLKKLKPFLK